MMSNGESGIIIIIVDIMVILCLGTQLRLLPTVHVVHTVLSSTRIASFSVAPAPRPSLQ